MELSEHLLEPFRARTRSSNASGIAAACRLGSPVVACAHVPVSLSDGSFWCHCAILLASTDKRLVYGRRQKANGPARSSVSSIVDPCANPV